MWQSPDPILNSYMSGETNGGVFNPKNLSLFTYTYNNPVNLVDPDGRLSRDAATQQAAKLNESGLNMSVVHMNPGDNGWFAADSDAAALVGSHGSNAENWYHKDAPVAEGVAKAVGVGVAIATIGKSIIEAGADKLSQKVSKKATISPSRHSIHQKINRSVKTSDEIDALKNPLDVRPVKYDNMGRPSQRYIGNKAEVAINPETNKIVSVNPTSSRKAARLKRKKE